MVLRGCFAAKKYKLVLLGPTQDLSNPATPISAYDASGYGGGAMGYSEDTNDMEFDYNDINITDILNITTNMYPDQLNPQQQM